MTEYLQLNNPTFKAGSVAGDAASFYVANWLISKTGIEAHPRIRHLIIFAVLDALNKFTVAGQKMIGNEREDAYKLEAITATEYFIISVISDMIFSKKGTFLRSLVNNLIRGGVGLAGNVIIDNIMINVGGVDPTKNGSNY